ncbi:hypothetical protein DPMN_041044 [Dreissena polymorpha]|uniref:Uncharacterized protein n=1 Tax=Dreissena polymorpha TaxID=45954 RepID=A0A9D4HTL2_DREPO|nr:hypothetical protein DPMN_041044 [Dreissena polymorpha]
MHNFSGAVCRGHEFDSEVSGEAIQRTQNDFRVYPTANEGIYGRYENYSKVVRRGKVDAARHLRTYRVGQNEVQPPEIKENGFEERTDSREYMISNKKISSSRLLRSNQ